MRTVRAAPGPCGRGRGRGYCHSMSGAARLVIVVLRDRTKGIRCGRLRGGRGAREVASYLSRGRNNSEWALRPWSRCSGVYIVACFGVCAICSRMGPIWGTTNCTIWAGSVPSR